MLDVLISYVLCKALLFNVEACVHFDLDIRSIDLLNIFACWVRKLSWIHGLELSDTALCSRAAGENAPDGCHAHLAYSADKPSLWLYLQGCRVPECNSLLDFHATSRNSTKAADSNLAMEWYFASA